MKPQPPYYESRFIRANDPDRARALWMRSTLLLPTAGVPGRRLVGDDLRPRRVGQPGTQAAASDRPVRLRGTTPGPPASARRPSTTGRRAGRSPARAGRRRWDLRITPGRRGAGQTAHRPRVQGEVPDGQDDGSPSARALRRQRRTRRRPTCRWTAGPAASTTTGAAATRPPTHSVRCAGSTRRRSRASRSSPRMPRSAPSHCPPPRCLVLRHDGREVAVRSVLADPPHAWRVPAVQLVLRRPCRTM